MVKRGRQAAGALGGLIRRSTKHVIGGKATSKSTKASSGKKEGSGTPAVANSPDAHSQNQADISSDVDADGYSGMETSDEGEHVQGAADFSVAAMDTPDKAKLPKSATKGRFVPSLRSPSEKDELNISDGGTDESKNGKAADNSNETSAKKGENPNQIWRAIIDANTLNTYYYNARTKETTWDKPEGFQDLSKEELTASLE